MSYASRILPALVELVDVLDAAGVKATLDRSRLPVPGAWVTPASAAQLTLGGGARLTVHVLLVAQDSGEGEALATLSGLLDLTLEAITPDGDVDTSVVLARPNLSPLPAFRVPVNIDI